MSARVAIALLGSAAVGAALHAQSCPLYATDFGSFAGPPDLVDGPFRVLWCASGSSIASSGFCPSGSALKLDAASEDPVLLVSVGDAQCSAIEISFTYAQFASSGTVLRSGATSSTVANCAAATPDVVGALSATGGACTNFTASIALAGASGVYLRFDHGANSNAILIDDLVIRRIGCCDAGHGCCATGPAGCADAAVAACVCALDPYCCATEWDAQCVEEVEALGCGQCGDGDECLEGLGIDFGSVYSGASICARMPEVFERCEGSPPFLTSSLGCASAGDMALRFAQGLPHSAAVTRCISFEDRKSPALSFRYSKLHATLGPRIDVSIGGGAWITAWTAPFAFAGGCAEVLLDLSALAGEPSVALRFASGSSVSNLATFDDVLLVEHVEVPHGCCETGTPSCDDAEVSACTCAIDPYCCATAWDLVCAGLATTWCGAGCAGLGVCGSPDAGDCLEPHEGPACADAACCLATCGIDAFCCEESWDAVCAALAAQECPPPADLDGDGAVGAGDLALLLAAWGAAGGDADLDGDGTVGAGDLAALLSAWTGA